MNNLKINDKDITIKPTDKGRGLVFMNKSNCHHHLVNKEHLHSNVYKEVPLDSDKKKLQIVLLV